MNLILFCINKIALSCPAFRKIVRELTTPDVPDPQRCLLLLNQYPGSPIKSSKYESEDLNNQ